MSPATRGGMGSARAAGGADRRLHRLGCRQMIAVVGDARNLASIRLHLSLGFKAVGFLPGAGRKPGGAVDVVLLQRSLCTQRRNDHRCSFSPASRLHVPFAARLTRAADLPMAELPRMHARCRPAHGRAAPERAIGPLTD